jgi:hypothetical protein
MSVSLAARLTMRLVIVWRCGRGGERSDGARTPTIGGLTFRNGAEPIDVLQTRSV